MSNKLKYVKVYDRIFEMIKNGEFPPGSRLPAENDLAEQMQVSRMTLRKALVLLQEDHLITNKNGIGSFVNSEEEQTEKEETRIGHPVFHCCSKTIDTTELEFRIEPPTRPIISMLEQETAAVVIADRWFKSEGNPSAYSLSFIPIEVISKEKINLGNPERLLEYLQSVVYKKSKKQICSFGYSTAGNFTSTKYPLSKEAAFIMIQESLYGEEEKPWVVSKTYIPVQLFKMDLYLKKM